jgi:hypothetical protein
MSALPPKADMFSVEIDVCFVPIGDISQLRQKERSPRGGLSESKAEPLEIDIFCDDTRPLRTISFTKRGYHLIHFAAASCSGNLGY